MNAENNEERDIYGAALVIIGDEILSGRTQDTNTGWIADKLTGHGILLGEVRIVPDDEDMIARTVNEMRAQYDYVFTTGGIGPTHDDITTASIGRAFGVKVERNDEAFKMLESHYGLAELTSARIKMSFIPVGATLIPNPVSGAPGFSMENVYVMAGVPRIMQAMFDHVLGTLRAGKPVLSNTIACSLQESILSEDLAELQSCYRDVQIGSYPHYRGGILGLSLVLRGIDAPLIQKATDDLLGLIRKHGDEPRAISIQSVQKSAQ